MTTTTTLTLPLAALLAGRVEDDTARASGGPAPAAATDEALLQRCAGGDTDAFTALYRRYERPVFGVLLRLAGQRALAEEWLQEAFTRVWLAAGTHDPARGAVRPWIYAIAVNTARTELSRRRARTPHVSIEETGLELLDGAAGEHPLLTGLDGRRQAELVAQALHTLPGYLREVVVLRCSRELSFAEIAAVTGAPPGTLKSRFHRAVIALRARVRRAQGIGR
ncbi:MAG TPA: sigma-70 family RNA polymerase sigma factor [Vicinamibacteria bacterium]